jgi:hypothetical protein
VWCWLRSSAGTIMMAATYMRGYKAIYIDAPIENSPINSDVSATPTFRALAVQFPYRTTPVSCTFLRSE